MTCHSGPGSAETDQGQCQGGEPLGASMDHSVPFSGDSVGLQYISAAIATVAVSEACVVQQLGPCGCG